MTTSSVSPLSLAGPLRYNEHVLRPVAGDGILELRDIIPEGPACSSINQVCAAYMCFLGTSVQASSISATYRENSSAPSKRPQHTLLNTELTWIFP